MITHIQKWGNSLAIRIPRSLAAEVDLELNSMVEIKQEQGHLILVPVRKPEYSLEQLLAQVYPENLHAEIDTGQAEGVEIW
jgi:antitoxin MazE